MARKAAAAGTSSGDEALAPLNRLVCDRVRELRKKRGWTLEQLATTSGVSRSMLSQIERGAASPTLGVAYRIAQAFGQSLSDLVEIQTPQRKVDVIRGDSQQFLFRDDDQCRVRTLSPLHLEKDVEFYELTLKPQGVLISAPHFVGTREFFTVVQGTVRITSGDESCELHRGDSAHYSADVPHQIENIGRSTATGFLVDIYER